MWHTEHTHDTPASPEAVFALWADVEGWPAWDASLVATTLDGPFAAGTAGTLHPQGMPEPIAFTITAVDDGAGFADETRLGPLVLRFRHRVEPRGDGARIVVTDRGRGARRRSGRAGGRRRPARERRGSGRRRPGRVRFRREVGVHVGLGEPGVPALARDHALAAGDARGARAPRPDPCPVRPARLGLVAGRAGRAALSAAAGRARRHRRDDDEPGRARAGAGGPGASGCATRPTAAACG